MLLWVMGYIRMVNPTVIAVAFFFFFCQRVSSLIRSSIVLGTLEVCEAFDTSKNDSADKMILGRANPKPE